MPASPYTIAGSLPWGGGGGGMFAGAGGSPQQALAGLGTSYANAYQSSLDMNRTNYSNILAGYQTAMGHQQSAEGGITGGYNDLYGNVMNTIKGIGASRGQEINDQYAQLQGQQSQGLINRGLGNTTVQNSIARGLTLDQQKAQTGLANQIAGTTAGYQSQLGLAGLSYQNQAAMQDTGLASQQLNWMNSVKAGYPDAGAYAALAQQYGSAQQAGLDRSALAGMRGGGGPGTAGGYVPSGGGFPPLQGFGTGYDKAGMQATVMPWNYYNVPAAQRGSVFGSDSPEKGYAGTVAPGESKGGYYGGGLAGVAGTGIGMGAGAYDAGWDKLSGDLGGSDPYGLGGQDDYGYYDTYGY